MQANGVIYIKVCDRDKGDVVFEGKVSADISPTELLKLECFQERNLVTIRDKRTGEIVESLNGGVELVASVYGLDRRFSGVLYVAAADGDGVLRKSTTVPTCECSLMSVWELSNDECQNAFKKCGLQELNITSCDGLKQIPHEIGTLKNLKKLTNYGLQMKSLPEEIGELAGLKELMLCFCTLLESLPKSIGKLHQLEKLKLSSLRRLKSLPEEIGELRCLKELCISDCAIEDLPKSVVGLTQLEKLTLRHVRHIPKEITRLSNLKQLCLCHGTVEQLPKNLNALQSLDLRNLVRYTLLPEDVALFAKLNTLVIVDLDECFFFSDLPVLQAFCCALEMSVTLHTVYLNMSNDDDDDDDNMMKMKMMIGLALQNNGSIVMGRGCLVSGHEQVLMRNRLNHKRARASVVVLMLALRRTRPTMNVPREIVQMLSKMLWLSRCDFQAWSKTM